MVGVHFRAMRPCSPCSRRAHVFETRTNVYVDTAFEHTGYRFMTSMSLFGLADGNVAGPRAQVGEEPRGRDRGAQRRLLRPRHRQVLIAGARRTGHGQRRHEEEHAGWPSPQSWARTTSGTVVSTGGTDGAPRPWRLRPPRRQRPGATDRPARQRDRDPADPRQLRGAPPARRVGAVRRGCGDGRPPADGPDPAGRPPEPDRAHRARGHLRAARPGARRRGDAHRHAARSQAREVRRREPARARAAVTPRFAWNAWSR